jgi:hypothetical protein
LPSIITVRNTKRIQAHRKRQTLDLAARDIRRFGIGEALSCKSD